MLAAHSALTTATVLTGFLILLGAKPADFAWAQAISVFAQGAPVLIAPWLTGSSKQRAILSLTLARVLWVPALALPWLLPGRAVGVFLALYLVNRVLDAVGQATWLTWMSSLVPAGIRGRYFARRNAVQLISGLVVGLAAAAVLDLGGRTAAAYGGLLAFTVVLSTASALLMKAQPQGVGRERRAAVGDEPEPAQPAARRLTLGYWTHVFFGGRTAPGAPPLPADARAAGSPDERRRFRRFLIFFALWGLGNGLAQPFWAPFELQNLKVSFGLLAAISAAGSLAGAITLPLWGRLADRIGDRTVLVITITWGSFHPLLWLGMTPARLWPLWLDATSSGIVWNGFELAATNLLLRLAPRGSGELAYGSLAAVRGLAGAASSMMAGVLIGRLPGAWGMPPMQLLLVAAAPVRWACLGMLWLVEDPRRRISRGSS